MINFISYYEIDQTRSIFCSIIGKIEQAFLNIPHKFYFIKFSGRTKTRHEKLLKMSKNINHASFVLNKTRCEYTYNIGITKGE